MRTLIAIPCMDTVHTLFLQSILGLSLDSGEVRYGTSCSSLIYNARNSLAKMAVDEEYDRVLWLDSDMVFDSDLLNRLSADLDAGPVFVSGLYFGRKNPINPVIYKETGYDSSEDGSRLIPFAKSYDDYPHDDLFEIKGAGFGAVMMSTDLIRQVYAKYGAPFAPMPGFGEDLSFCRRCEELGVTMYCDSRIKLGHVAYSVVTEDRYMAGAVL